VHGPRRRRRSPTRRCSGSPRPVSGRRDLRPPDVDPRDHLGEGVPTDEHAARLGDTVLVGLAGDRAPVRTHGQVDQVPPHVRREGVAEGAARSAADAHARPRDVAGDVELHRGGHRQRGRDARAFDGCAEGDELEDHVLERIAARSTTQAEGADREARVDRRGRGGGRAGDRGMADEHAGDDQQDDDHEVAEARGGIGAHGRVVRRARNASATPDAAAGSEPVGAGQSGSSVACDRCIHQGPQRPARSTARRRWCRARWVSPTVSASKPSVWSTGPRNTPGPGW
jgi:hypothetical protein